MSRKITLNCKFECRSVDKPSALHCGLVRGVVQIPTFAKLYIDTVGFIFIFCSCVIYRCLDTCKNNSHMFHFKLFALFWYCNTSNAARRTRGGGTLESGTQRLSAHYGKGVHRNPVLHFLAEHKAFSTKWRNSLEVGKLGNDLTYYSTHSGEQ